MPPPFGLLKQKAFAPWRLAASTDCGSAGTFLPQGSSLDLSSQDALRRQIYSLSLDEKTVPLCREIGANQAHSFRSIQPSDNLPSMENIFFTNNGALNADHILVDWFEQGNKGASTGLFLTYAIDHPPFTAQTVIASSYGLHQLLYTSAVDTGYKDKDGVGLPPGGLFDPSASLDLGTEFLARKFKSSDGAQNTDQSSYNDLLIQFAPALKAFNGGAKVRVLNAQVACSASKVAIQFIYSCSILKNTPNYDPVPLAQPSNGGGGGPPSS